MNGDGFSGESAIKIGRIRGDKDMATTLVNFRLDTETKAEMEKVCTELGMSMSTAFTIFANKVSREHRIPFEVSIDPFYSEKNMDDLKHIIADYAAGKGKVVNHDTIEV